MNFDDLSEIYRQEMKSTGLTQTSRRLYEDMAEYVVSLKREYDSALGADPESVMTDGARQRYRKASRLMDDIHRIRGQKVIRLAAVSNTLGTAPESFQGLPQIERDLFETVSRSLHDFDTGFGRIIDAATSDGRDAE